MKDKYTALWISYSTISDFLACPRAYFLKNVYRDPKTGHKIKLITAPLSLGAAVHEVIDTISTLPVKDRLKESLVIRFHNIWKKYQGKRGGFFNEESETQYKKRGEAMLLRLMKNPGPLVNLAVKIQMDLPNYWLSEEENIILCGRVDWLEYDQKTDSVHIIDFKTNKYEEDGDSLQLAIYELLATHCQTHKVSGASYWYLEREDGLVAKKLENMETAEKKIFEIAKQIKLARQLTHFKCPKGEDGCNVCLPYEAIVSGNAEMVGTDERNTDLFILDSAYSEGPQKSVIL